MKPIIKWTVWQRRWSIIWWSIGIFSFIFINMIFYPTFKNEASELQKSFENLPDAALQLFGGSADFFSPIGFINSQIFFIMLPLLLGILAISLGSSLLAREEQDKTIEALLARPISRSRLLAGKTLAGLAILGIVSLVGFFTTLVTAKYVGLEVSDLSVAGATFACFMLAVSFGAVALLFTALGRARAASLGLASTIALGGYFISSLAGTVSWLEIPSKIFPFYYYQSEAIFRGTYNWANLMFPVAIIVGCGLISWMVFRKRDIY